jgi:conjugative transfer pilus assembly protein TraH
MPRLKVGCGGIDLFMGGFSFLNFEYLVQKLQTMIQAAPYVAFQIALKTISQKLGGILSEAEQIINNLNSMQFNECKFLEGFMVKLRDTGDITAALEEGAIKAGIYPFWKKSTENTKPSGVKDTKSEDLIKGCPSDVQTVLNNFDGKGLLDNIATRRGYNNPELIGLIRAAVGDMYLKYDSSSGVPIISYIPPCGDFFSEMQAKKVVRIRRSWNDQCEPYDLNQFFSKIRQDLLNLYSQMQRKGNTLTNPQTQVLNPRKTPLPIYLITKTAIMTKDPALIESIVEPIGYGYLRNAMAEMISIAYADVQEAFNVLSNAERLTQEQQTKDPSKVCKVPQIQQKYVETMLMNHYKAMQSMNNAFIATLSQVEALINVVNKYQNFYDIAARNLALKFGVFPTNRVLSGI